jgi:hypothetical protein
MGIGRGSVGIVPTHLAGMYVSSEYTILTAENHLDAVYFSGVLRTKEILGDILCSTTGMNRGRIRWEDMRHIEVPIRSANDEGAKAAVKALEAEWKAYGRLVAERAKFLHRVTGRFKLEGDASRLRWLAYKPPE